MSVRPYPDLASKPLDLVWPNSHQTWSLGQNIRKRNCLKKVLKLIPILAKKINLNILQLNGSIDFDNSNGVSTVCGKFWYQSLLLQLLIICIIQ